MYSVLSESHVRSISAMEPRPPDGAVAPEDAVACQEALYKTTS